MWWLTIWRQANCFQDQQKNGLETDRSSLMQSEMHSMPQRWCPILKDIFWCGNEYITVDMIWWCVSAAAAEYKWHLNYGGIALMWRGGCIIRSKFLGKIKEAFDKNPNLNNLLLDPFFQEKITNCQKGWREVHDIPSIELLLTCEGCISCCSSWNSTSWNECCTCLLWRTEMWKTAC